MPRYAEDGLAEEKAKRHLNSMGVSLGTTNNFSKSIEVLEPTEDPLVGVGDHVGGGKRKFRRRNTPRAADVAIAIIN